MRNWGSGSVFAWVLLICCVAGCATPPGDPAVVEVQDAIVVSRNHYHAFHILAPVVAREKGFFEGIDVEIRPDEVEPEITDGSEMLSRMQAEGIDIIVDARPRLLFNQASPDQGLVMIGGWMEGGNVLAKLMAGPDIQTVADLGGKRLSTTTRIAENAVALEYWLSLEGLDPDSDVEWVLDLSRANLAPEALREGRIDAGSIGPEAALQLEQEGYHVLLDWAEVYPEGRPERVIVATRELVENNPEGVKAFLRGMIRAYRLINDWQNNDDFLQPIMQPLMEGARDPRGESYQDTPLLEDGMIPIEALQTMLDEAKVLGGADEGLLLDAVVDLEPLAETIDELAQDNIIY